MDKADRHIYQVPPYRGYVLHRPMPIHQQRIDTPFWNDPSRIHLNLMFHQSLLHNMHRSHDDRMYGHPMFPNPYQDEGIFYLRDLWTKPSRPLFRHTYSQGQRIRPQNAAPIVDFSDTNPRNEEPWDENIGGEEIDPGRLREISSDNLDLDQLDSVSAAGENGQAEPAPESEYVPLETIRRVKRQAREQALRMRDHQSSETIEMEEMNDQIQQHSARYDRPRRRDFSRTGQTKSQRIIHNPSAAQKGSKQRFVGVSHGNREWTPGGSSIPDGIIAGASSNVTGERLISIPDSAHYATISESSDVQSSNGAPELPDRPQNLPSGKGRHIKRSTKKQAPRRYTSSAQQLTDETKERDAAATCKRLICIFIVVTLLLVLLTIAGLVLLFFFSSVFKDCREDTECTRRSVFITAVVIAGCTVLCLLISCCFWCLFVTYSHVINRRRAYPIHHRPTTQSIH